MNSVSVIIPCYNGAIFLSDAIESVLNQSYPVSELIVVDDGSTDNTKEVCDRYSKVHYIYKKNGGLPAARNTGIAASKGEYLIFLDADDRLLPHAVETGIRWLNECPDAGLAFGSHRTIQTDGSPILESPGKLIEVANYKTFLSCQHLVAPATFMVRRSSGDLAGWFNPALAAAEDTDFWLRIAKNFSTCAHNEIVAEKRVHDSNMSGNPSRMLKATLHMLSLHRQYVVQSGNKDYQSAYEAGKRFWLELFGPILPYQMVRYIKAGQWLESLKVLFLILRYYPQGLMRYGWELLHKVIHRFKPSLV